MITANDVRIAATVRNHVQIDGLSKPNVKACYTRGSKQCMLSFKLMQVIFHQLMICSLNVSCLVVIKKKLIS